MDENHVSSVNERTLGKNLIEVGMADLKIATAPSILVTRGLGSCVGITFYEPFKRLGAMAHAMLPDINNSKIKSNPARFVNSAIDKILEELKKQGCVKRHLQVKLFGGARMFSFIAQDSVLNVGERNVVMAKEILASHGITIVAQDVGGNFGRTIELNLENGKVHIKTIYSGEKEA
jgi:chemotaxis protein CheD